MTKVNTNLIKQALLAKQANKRQTTSHTKGRSEVSGGGRKPWRQKGTGRARAGSNRSPIWVGGGITFGPTKQRTYKQFLSKRMNKKAIAEMLKHLQVEGKLIVTDSLSLKEAKTKSALKLLSTLELTGKKAALITNKIEPELVLATRNIPGVKTVIAANLSITDLISGTAVVEKDTAENWGLVKKATAKKSTTQEKK